MTGTAEPYVLLHARGRTRRMTGTIVRSRLLADVPRPGALPVVNMVPYAQLRERGFVVHDDGAQILSLVAESVEDVDLASLPDPAGADLQLSPLRLTTSDDEYADIVARVIRDEICAGEGANFLISRQARLTAYDLSDEHVRRIFVRLVIGEPNAYLVFCFFDGERYFLGASPERHITVAAGEVTMSPICGTMPKAALTRRADLIEFITDPKEINELFQVVDEELKMMSRICEQGGQIEGPYLQEMSAVVHTAYDLRGRTTLDPMEAFRASMFAATMVGSPLENAARIIHKYETRSRRYYSSAIMICETGSAGTQDLDSAITIRTMEITREGEIVLQSGGTIVRDSEPEKETREIVAKMEGMLRSLAGLPAGQPVLHHYVDRQVQDILMLRNKYLSRFWTADQGGSPHSPAAVPLDILVIDNEDEFTYMLRHALRSMGHRVTWRRYDAPDLTLQGWDVVLVGPGPGDPLSPDSPKMVAVRAMIDELLATGTTFLAVCLAHQILCHRLGMSIVALDPPKQGVQEPIDHFGRQEAVGFYNTFCPVVPEHAPPGVIVSVSADGEYVVALRGPHYASFQFHVESVLTSNSITILKEALDWLLASTHSSDPSPTMSC
jgi:phenazine biosynthesis protein phzE